MDSGKLEIGTIAAADSDIVTPSTTTQTTVTAMGPAGQVGWLGDRGARANLAVLGAPVPTRHRYARGSPF